MKTFIAEHPSLTIRELQDYLSKLYGRPNIQRDFESYYAYLDRTAGYLCKSIYRQNARPQEFIRPISWLFSLATNQKIDVEDAFLQRYPGACPYCLENPCVCFKTGQQPATPLPAYRVQEEMDYKYNTLKNTTREPFTLDWAVKNIESIYGVNEVIWYYAGPWHHISKIHEEIAEIHEAYTRLKRGEIHRVVLASEIADVLAWMLGVWGILFPEKSLVEEFIDYYYLGCPVCKSNPCVCDLYAGRPEGLMDYKLLIQARNLLQELSHELSAIVPDYQKELNDLILSFDVAVKTQNEPTAKLSVSQAQAKLKPLREILLSSETSQRTVALFADLLTIINTLSRFL